MRSPRLLLVDDDPSVRAGLKGLLEACHFDVATAASVIEALQRLTHESFDILLSDLHMPNPGDGLTVVSAMRHANPRAITIILSAMPDMLQAAAALVDQVDEIVTKPATGASIVRLIRQRLANYPVEPPAELPGQAAASILERVAALIERDTPALLRDCCLRIATERGAARHGPAFPSRSPDPVFDHLDHTLRDVIFRLRHPLPLATLSQVSLDAQRHGARRRRQGDPPAELAEEMRIVHAVLSAAVAAETQSLTRLNAARPCLVSAALATISDELHAQLAQSLAGYANESPIIPSFRAV